ncbi:MAG: beta-galactosidase [Gorillibacterium sp.]|nr:beta-galactosidase [Gorillibacterium sp.]
MKSEEYNIMKIGVDYYPEQWPKNMWVKDAKHMAETGVRIVRLAEFAWSRMEPTEGVYNFAWLDEAIDILHEQGIEIILGTPTATPPNWLVERYLDVLPVNNQEKQIYPGVRGHRCYNSPSLRTFAAKITKEMTNRYAQHPAVVGWQIDNEFGLMDCHCENCIARFREWLQNKYGSLQAMNESWGTVVWSGEFSNWSQIRTPLGGSTTQNPGYLLDFERFGTDSCIEFQRMQVAIIRKSCPDQWITHNIWGYPKGLDYYKLFEDLDFASLDYYPNTDLSAPKNNPTFILDLVRGVKRQNFCVMEQLSGTPGCWGPMSRTPYPGMIRAHAWQAISRGADTVVHFRWRSATLGAEQFWHGIIDHSNVPGRRFEEFKQVALEVNRLGETLDGTTITNQVALLFSHEQFSALEIQPQVDGMKYFENLKKLHTAFLELGVGTDVINWTDDYSGYKILIVHSLYLLTEEVARRVEQFAADGGTVVITNRTGVKNEYNMCWMEPLPGPLRHAAGTIVEEYDPIGHMTHYVTWKDGKDYACAQWCDILQPETSEVLGVYNDDFFKGKPAVTLNRMGMGKIYYIGTWLETEFYKSLFLDCIEELQIDRFVGLPEGCEVSVRTNGIRKFLFIFNFSKNPAIIPLTGSFCSLLNNKKHHNELTIDGFDIEILEMAP